MCLSYIPLVSSLHFSHAGFTFALTDPFNVFFLLNLKPRYEKLCNCSNSKLLQFTNLADTFSLLLTMTLFLIILTFKLCFFTLPCYFSRFFCSSSSLSANTTSSSANRRSHGIPSLNIYLKCPGLA